ncbi:MAG TPA: serine hydrolase domain-containing protein, partial [Chitinophagaceae bacterium]
MKKSFCITILLTASMMHVLAQSLPRSTPEAEKFRPGAVSDYLNAVKENKQDIHSLMILRHGKVIAEHWFGDNAADKPHVLYSVSKTFTATAIGFLVSEKRLKVTDKVISFFPDQLPDTVSLNLSELQVKHLLTMSVGHDVNLVNGERRNQTKDWVRLFLSN